MYCGRKDCALWEDFLRDKKRGEGDEGMKERKTEYRKKLLTWGLLILCTPVVGGNVLQFALFHAVH